MGQAAQIAGIIPTVLTIAVVSRIASKFSSGKSKDFSHERSFSRLNKKDNQRL